MEHANSESLLHALATVLHEILEGADPKAGWLLNPADAGLLRSLERLSAKDASTSAYEGASSIAAHVEHLRYGLELLNRWARDENPYSDADWAAAWRRTAVTPAEWARLRAELRTEAERWQQDLPRLVGRDTAGLTAVIASAAHLAYHLGAIRQLHRAVRGPTAEDGQ